MNILPKKRWHVRTKDNIARVRKDEATAREELRKKEEKLKLAESEARINFLRTRSGQPEKQQHEIAEETPVDGEACSSKHVNLFADYKTHVKTTNKDLEKEKKDEQEEYEKKIGYLTYLGQDTNEALRLKSWYEVAPKRLVLRSERGEICEKDVKIKHNHDPLTLINALLPPDPAPIVQSISSKHRSSSNDLTKEKGFHSKPPMRHKKVHKKEKRSKEHKHKKEKRKEKNIMEELEKRLKLEKLRRQRLHRETVERARQEALLIPKEFKKPTDVISSLPKIKKQKYNNQFNPELAKQNIN